MSPEECLEEVAAEDLSTLATRLVDACEGHTDEDLRLILCVEINPCLYDKNNELNKSSDYRFKVWDLIARVLNYGEGGADLEKKWRHMRDRYVRLRKAELLTGENPIRRGDKWRVYYPRMRFLDPFVEHRRRFKRGEQSSETSIDYSSFFNLPSTSPFDPIQSSVDVPQSSSAEILGRMLDIKPDAPVVCVDVSDDDSLGSRSPALVRAEIGGGETMNASQIVPKPSVLPPPPQPAPCRKRATEVSSSDASVMKKSKEEEGEGEVALFIRSITHSLSEMDRRTFALARAGISKVLFQCQYGSDADKMKLLNGD